MKIKYEDITIEEIEIMYNYLNSAALEEQEFICDGDNKVIIVGE